MDAKKKKILGAVLAIPFPAYLIHMLFNENLLLHVVFLSVTGLMCIVGEIKEQIKEDFSEVKEDLTN